MNDILVFDTNILMDCLLFEFCTDEKDAYKSIIDTLKSNNISTRKLVEEITDTDKKNIEDALDKRKDVYKYISLSIDKLISHLNNPSIAITTDVEREFRYNLTNGDIDIIKSKVSDKNVNDRNKYINMVISRLVYSRYGSLIDEYLSNYKILEKVNKYILPIKPKDDKDDWLIYNSSLIHNVKGIVTNNVFHFENISKTCVPILKIGVDIYSVSYSAVNFGYYPWNNYLKPNKQSNTKSTKLLNLIRNLKNNK